MNHPYPYLPEGKSIRYVPISDPYMAEAKRVCLEHSTDHNHPTGAVVVKDGHIIGWGANQSAIKNKTLLSWHKKFLCVRKWLKIRSGTKYWLCPGCASARMHAEARSVKDVMKKSADTHGADLYLWGHWWCCKPCWDSMLAGGIRDVYLVEGATEQFKK
jgi:deoxycytidylate deaminase